MNERIKRFSEQAINYATSKRPLPDLKDKDLFLNNLFERFAELIVSECIAKYNEWAEHSTDKTSFAMAQHNVKKHFGDEE